MVGLTHNERCLIYNLRVKKHWEIRGFDKNDENVSE